MGRKHRSSSMSITKATTRPKSSSPSTAQTSGVDIDACNSLLKHFIHDKDSSGRTFLHNAVRAVSSGATSEQKFDGYYLMDGICKRAKEFDKIVNEKGRGARGHMPISHLQQLMLAKDEENGYTPLHYAILKRDLISLLLLLKHSSTEFENDKDTMYSEQMQHPLRLLDYRGDDDGISRVMKDLVVSVDNESLSPLRLLGVTSISELEKCRSSLHWSHLKQIWKKQIQSHIDDIDKPDNNPRRHRQRMISFGDERDYLNNDVVESPANNSFDRRSRSGSFLVDGLEDEEDDENVWVGDHLSPENVDFTLYNELDSAKNGACNEVLAVGDGSVDYGCELFTFGRADHCALGVPRFSTGGKRDKQFSDDIGSRKRNEQSNDAASHKPKRVEAFSLGDMRRKWSDPNLTFSKEKEAVDSPVVAVAAATHHTLALTRGGRLFAFGLGKGGRLGTGDENHRALPTRILGPLSKRIVTSIACAENHSLCSTAFDGGCYAWGSNGFGQLGIPSEQNQVSRLSPRRVDELKSTFIVSVAAGDRHSVALSRSGEVHCWGDNKSGQCGRSPNVSVSPTNARFSYRPTRVEALASRTCIAVAASEFSTLILARPPTNGEGSLASLPVNAVFGWGHGNFIPLKVNFPTAKDNHSSNHLCAFSRTTCINPVCIASAKYHNVAITADGRVFTWGISSELSGSKDGCHAVPKVKASIGNSLIASPQLVTGMLPEEGGGCVVAVSTSESHTAVVTAEGYLYTWGSSYGTNTLLHKGVNWQPTPRKVKRVQRAVGLAVAKEHTVLLVGTSFPRLPCSFPSSESATYNPLSLQDSVVWEISRNVDLFNVISISGVARRLNATTLLEYCNKFIELNLDGVLGYAINPSDLELLVKKEMTFASPCSDTNNDGIFHPFLYKIAADPEDWMRNSTDTLKSLKGCFAKKQKRQSNSKSSLSKSPNKAMAHEPIKSVSSSILELEDTSAMVAIQVNKNVKEDKSVSKVKSPRDNSKYHCTVCAISCPDDASFTLHMSGRKHRNRLNHARQEEEKEVAEEMMNMKQMQLLNMDNDSISIVDSRAAKTPFTKSSAWASPRPTEQQATSFSVDTKPRSVSLLGIMNEEFRNLTSPPPNTSNSLVSKSRANTASHSSRKLSFSPQSSTPTWMIDKMSNSSFSLGAFIKDDKINPHELKAVKATWAVPQPLSKTVPALSRKNKIKSFVDIQREEMDSRKREDHMCHLVGNKWFVQQRDRADSIGDIQRKEQEEAAWLSLVEEQKKIEAEIVRESKINAKQRKPNVYKNRQQL